MKITNVQPDGSFTMQVQLPEGFLPKLPKRAKSREQQIHAELSAIRKVDKRRALPEVVDFLKAYAAKLDDELKVIQRRKV
jgi:hypothetical protein